MYGISLSPGMQTHSPLWSVLYLEQLKCTVYFIDLKLTFLFSREFMDIVEMYKYISKLP